MAGTAEAIGVAVVGAGYWGPNLVRNFRANRRTELLWVCDVSEERARQVVGPRTAVRLTTSLEEVLDDSRVRAVAVATPSSTHATIGLAALEAGKHVLMEKPLASSSPDAEKLVICAHEHDAVLMCDHTYCYSPAVQRLREWVRSGAAGEIRYFDSVRINLGLVQADVDVFWDLGPHDLSILEFVLPPGCVPEAVWAHAADPAGVGRPCIGYMTLPLTGGAIAHFAFNWLSPTKIRQTIVGGSKQMLVWDDLDPAHRLRIYDKGVDISEVVTRADRRERLVSYRTGDMVAPALPEVEALSRVIEEFVDAIVENRPAATSGEAGLRIVRLLEAAERSLEAGGALVPVCLEGRG